MIENRKTGTVLNYKRSGFGWLDCDGQAVWIHVQDVHDRQGHLVPQLKVGWKIEFDLFLAPKGPRAKSAIVVEMNATNLEENSNEHQR